MRRIVVGALAPIALMAAACTAPSTGSEPAEGPATTQSPTSESTATQEPLGEPGSPEQPLPAGTELTFTDGGGREVRIVVRPACWEAGALVAAANEYNTPAPEGTTYVLVPVTITNVHSDTSLWPFVVSQSMRYVAPDGQTIDRAAQPALPCDLRDAAGLNEGDSVTGNIAFAIPSETHGGAWAVSWSWDGWTYTDPLFVGAN